MGKFRDARGRPVTFVTDDGTNILVTRSGDAGLAQVTDSGGRGGMNKGVCFLISVTVGLDGTIVGIRPAPAISGGRRAGKGAFLHILLIFLTLKPTTSYLLSFYFPHTSFQVMALPWQPSSGLLSGRSSRLASTPSSLVLTRGEWG